MKPSRLDGRDGNVCFCYILIICLMIQEVVFFLTFSKRNSCTKMKKVKASINELLKNFYHY